MLLFYRPSIITNSISHFNVFLLPDCVGNFTCENFGTCQYDNTSSSLYCSCLPGYAGDRCELEKRLCDDDPCPESSICLHRINGFLCKCTRSSADDCENTIEPLDMCARGNHRCPDDTCLPLFHQYYCNCPTIMPVNALNTDNCGLVFTAETITRNTPTPENLPNDDNTGTSDNLWWFLLIAMAAVLLIVFVTILTYTQCARSKDASSNK